MSEKTTNVKDEAENKNKKTTLKTFTKKLNTETAPDPNDILKQLKKKEGK